MDGSRFEGFYVGGQRHGPGRWIIAGLQPGERPVREGTFENGEEKANQSNSQIYQEHHNNIFKACLTKNSGSLNLYRKLKQEVKKLKVDHLAEAYEKFGLYEQSSDNANTRAILRFQPVDLVLNPDEDKDSRHDKEKWFLHGAAYFGEWKRDAKDRWVPDGRGIVINYKQ